jgi:hypothetical protein
MAAQKKAENEISVTYNGIKSTPGDRDNMPTKEHEFVVEDTGRTLRINTIKLLQYAPIKKGQKYVMGFDGPDLYVPVSIMVEGTLYYKETNNRIISIDPKGNKVNHSDNPIFKSMGQFTREQNRKLIAEGKPPIKPIRRRW